MIEASVAESLEATANQMGISIDDLVAQMLAHFERRRRDPRGFRPISVGRMELVAAEGPTESELDELLGWNASKAAQLKRAIASHKGHVVPGSSKCEPLAVSYVPTYEQMQALNPQPVSLA